MILKTILVIILFSSTIVRGQQFILQNENGAFLKNHKISISQGFKTLERFTDSLGYLKLDKNFFNFNNPITILPESYVAITTTLSNEIDTLSFKPNLFNLDPIIVHGKKNKKIDYKNFKLKENRLSGLLGRKKRIIGFLLPNVEYITSIELLKQDPEIDVLSKISFQVETSSPSLERDIKARLNFYNKDKELFYSQDNVVNLKDIVKDLVFTLPNEKKLISQLSYVGISYIPILPTDAVYGSKYSYLLKLLFSEFKRPKTYISKNGGKWVIYSREEEELDDWIKHVLLELPPVNGFNNLNPHITIEAEIYR
jgi:hypothetical protein